MVPSISATVANLRFFETAATTTLLNDRVYKTHFDKDATRYVSWEVSLLHPAYGVDRTFLYESVVRDAAGRSIAQQSFSSTIEDY
jgi:hypothetical protein